MSMCQGIPLIELDLFETHTLELSTELSYSSFWITNLGNYVFAKNMQQNTKLTTYRMKHS